MTIYFIEMEGLSFIKIGYTAADAEQRMAQLQTGQPYRLRLIGTMPGDKKAEHALHKELDAYRSTGEWFSATTYVRELIAYLIEKQGPWYICRGFRGSWEMLEGEWREAFAGTAIDSEVPLVFGNEQQIARAADLISGFRQRFDMSIEDAIHPSYVAIFRKTLFPLAQYASSWFVIPDRPPRAQTPDWRDRQIMKRNRQIETTRFERDLLELEKADLLHKLKNRGMIAQLLCPV